MVERNLISHPLPAIVSSKIKVLVPVGGYCHAVQKNMSPGGQQIKIRYCPFWYGERPGGACLLYGKNAYLEDAIKVCRTNKPVIKLPVKG